MSCLLRPKPRPLVSARETAAPIAPSRAETPRRSISPLLEERRGVYFRDPIQVDLRKMFRREARNIALITGSFLFGGWLIGEALVKLFSTILFWGVL